MPDRDTFVALAELCHDRGIVLLCDEAHRVSEVDPATTLPHAADLTASATPQIQLARTASVSLTYRIPITSATRRQRHACLVWMDRVPMTRPHRR